MVLAFSVCVFAQDESEQGAPDISTNWKQDSKTIVTLLSGIREYRSSRDDTDLQAEHKKEMLNKTLVEINKKYKGTKLHLNAVMVEEVEEEKKLNKEGALKMLLSANDLGNEKVASDKEINAMINKAKRDKSDKNFTAREKQIIEKLTTKFKNPLYQFALLLMIPTDDKYYNKTGNYEITYHIPVPESSMYSGSTGYHDYKHGILASDREKVNGNETEIIEVTITKTITDKGKAMEIKKGSVQQLQGIIEGIYYKGGTFEKISIDLK